MMLVGRSLLLYLLLYLRVSRSGPGPQGVISNTVGWHSTVPFSEHLLGVLSFYLSIIATIGSRATREADVGSRSLC